MNWQNIDGHLRKYGPLFQFVFLFSLVLADILFPDSVIITWHLVVLIVLLVVIPYVPLIKKIKYGDWEAELESLLVRAERTIDEPEIAESTSKGSDREREAEIEDDETKDKDEAEQDNGASSTEPEETATKDSTEEEISTLRKIVNANERISNFEKEVDVYLSDDPKVALSYLRIELDRTLGAIADQHEIKSYQNIGMPIHVLVKNDILEKEDIDDLNQVYEIADKAIHGEEVKKETAKRIVELGERVLKRLYIDIDAEISTDPTEPPIDLES